MSLTPAETEFADLLDRCGLPEITRGDLLDKFFAQSRVAEKLLEEVERLRAFERAIAFATAELHPRPHVPASPPLLRLVREEA